MLKQLNLYWSVLLRSFKVETLVFFRDKALYFSVLVTGVIISFINSSTYSKEVPQKLAFAVVDMDNSSLSRELVRMLGATQNVSIKHVDQNMDGAKREFADGDVYGILYIPGDFQRKISIGTSAQVVLYSDASNMMVNKLISGATAGALGTFNAQLEVNKYMHKGVSMVNSTASRRPITSITNMLYNPYGGYGTFLLPVVYLIIIQSLLLTAIGVIGGTLREFNKYFMVYSHPRQLSSKIFMPFPMLLGRGIAYLFVCMSVFSIICGACFMTFKLPFRAHFMDTLMYLIPFFLSVIFMGFSIQGICKRREDATLFVTFLSIPAVFLCGASWPTAALPAWVNSLSYILPTTLGAKGFTYLSQFGAGFNEVKDIWIQLWITALLYFILSVLVNYRLSVRHHASHTKK